METGRNLKKDRTERRRERKREVLKKRKDRSFSVGETLRLTGGPSAPGNPGNPDLPRGP